MTLISRHRLDFIPFSTSLYIYVSYVCSFGLYYTAVTFWSVFYTIIVLVGLRVQACLENFDLWRWFDCFRARSHTRRRILTWFSKTITKRPEIIFSDLLEAYNIVIILIYYITLCRVHVKRFPRTQTQTVFKRID